VINDKGYHGASADIWSCGVILFVLMAGYLPFDETNLMTLYKKVSGNVSISLLISVMLFLFVVLTKQIFHLWSNMYLVLQPGFDRLISCPVCRYIEQIFLVLPGFQTVLES
jgi:serine/threonine protein kinase